MSDTHKAFLDWMEEVQEEPEMKEMLNNRKTTIIVVGLSETTCEQIVRANMESCLHSTVVTYHRPAHDALAKSLRLKSLLGGIEHRSSGDLVSVATYPTVTSPNFDWVAGLVDSGIYKVAGIVFALADYDPATRWDDADYYLKREVPQFERIPAWYLHEVLGDSLGLLASLINCYYDELGENGKVIFTCPQYKDDATDQIKFVGDFLGMVIVAYLGSLCEHFGSAKIEVIDIKIQGLDAVDELRSGITQPKS